MVNDNIHYVYVYLDPRRPSQWNVLNKFTFDYEPFYVGKGKGSRMLVHLRDTSATRKVNKIKAIKQLNLEPIIVKVIEHLSDDESKAIEKSMIADLGTIEIVHNVKRGPLTNLTEGGEGGKPSEAGIQRIRESKLGKSRTNYNPTAETRLKLGAAHKNKPKSDAQKKKISNAHQKLWDLEFNDGRLPITIKSLKAYCIENDLIYSSMKGTLKGGFHRGVRAIRNYSENSTK